MAAAQVGEHNAKRSSYGNAVIVDPWGKIIAKRLADQSIGLEIAEIDSDYVEKVRRNQPVLEHRRNDVYSIVTNSDVQIYEGLKIEYALYKQKPPILTEQHVFSFQLKLDQSILVAIQFLANRYFCIRPCLLLSSISSP